MSGPPRIVLASASPRRKAVLEQLGLSADTAPADVDESYLDGETPEAHVERLAREKAAVIARAHPDALVIGGDTVVVNAGQVLTKPGSAAEAVDMLLRLSGGTHHVLSALALTGPFGTVSRVARADVRFRAIPRETAEAYVATEEPMDKAGGYGIQGLGAALVEEIQGDYYCVKGFPVAAFMDLLVEAGFRYAFGRLEPLQDPARD